MGVFSSKIKQILILGLDGSGKTTIINRFKYGVSPETIPTIGYNNEIIKYKKYKFDMWDVGGNSNLRILWKYYIANIKGIIYVIDSNDKDRLFLSRDCLEDFLYINKLNNIPILMLANKQDYETATNMKKLNDIFTDYFINEKIVLKSCCAIKGVGLYEGLKWLSKNI